MVFQTNQTGNRTEFFWEAGLATGDNTIHNKLGGVVQ
jgi:hypothetical protein